MKEIKITIKTAKYSAFEEDNLYPELTRILRKLANSIEAEYVPSCLMDINGNKVGKVEVK